MDEEQYFQQFEKNLSGLTPEQQDLFKSVVVSANSYRPGMMNNVSGEEEGDRPLSSYTADVQNLIRDPRFQSVFNEAQDEQYAKILRDAGISAEEWLANNPRGEDNTDYTLKVLRAANYNNINKRESIFSDPESENYIADEAERTKALEKIQSDADGAFQYSFLFPSLGGKLNEIVPESIKSDPNKMRDFELAFRGQFGIGLDFDESGRIGDVYQGGALGAALTPFREVGYLAVDVLSAFQNTALDLGAAIVDLSKMVQSDPLSDEAADLKFKIAQQQGEEKTYLEAAESSFNPSLYYAALFSPEARRQFLETQGTPKKTVNIQTLLENPSEVGVLGALGLGVDMIIDSAPLIAEIKAGEIAAKAALKGATRSISKSAARKAGSFFSPVRTARTGELLSASEAAKKAERVTSLANLANKRLTQAGTVVFSDVLVAASVHADNSDQEWYKNLSGGEKASFLAQQSSAEVIGGMVLANVLGGNGFISKASQALFKGQKSAINKFGAEIVKSTFFGISEEAAAEAATAGWQYYSEIQARKDGGDVTAVWDTSEWKKTMFEAAAAGALMGGIGGFGGGAVRASAKAMIAKFHPEIKRLQKDVEEAAKAVDSAKTKEEKQKAKESLQEIVGRYAGAQSSVVRAYVKLAEANPEAFEELARIQGKINAEVTRYKAGDYSSSEKSNARKRVKRLVQKKNDLQNKAISESTAEGLADFTSFDDLVNSEAETVAKERILKFGEWKQSPRTTASEQTTELLRQEKEAMSASLEAAQAVNSQEQNADDDLQDSQGETLEDLGIDEDYQPTEDDVVEADEKGVFNPLALEGTPFADIYRDVVDKINNFTKAFKRMGINVVVHKNKNSYYQATGGEVGNGYILGKTIHLNLEAIAARVERERNDPSLEKGDTIRHEFLHAAFRTLTPEQKKQFLDEMKSIPALKPYYKAIQAMVAEKYPNYTAEQKVEEEAVTMLEYLLNRPELEAKKPGILTRIYNILAKLIPGLKEVNIKETDLQGFVRVFRESERKGTDFAGQSVSDVGPMASRDYGMRQPSKAYPDLINKVVNYRVYYLDKIGGQQSYQANGLKFNDYWHFRNWYLRETGNGKMANSIGGFTYIGDDGTIKKINPPKPKRDRETGEIIDMEPRLKTPTQRKMDSAATQAERRKRLLRYADIRKNAGDALKFAVGKIRKIEKTGELAFYNENMLLEQDSQSELPVAYSETFFVDGLNVDELDQLGTDFGDNLQFLIPTTTDAQFAFTVRNNGDGTVTIDAHSDVLTGFGKGQGDVVAEGFASRDTEGLRITKEEESKRRALKPRWAKEDDMGDILEDTMDKFALAFGFDQTFLYSGVKELVKSGSETISSHIDLIKAQAIVSQLKDMARKVAAEQGLKEGDIGEIVIFHTLLGEESTLGNPYVFKDAMKLVEPQDIIKILNSQTNDAKAVRNAILKYANNDPEIIALILKSNKKGRIGLEDVDAALTEKITKILIEKSDKDDYFTFSKRTKIAKQLLDTGRRESLYEKHNDKQFKDAQKGEVVAYTVIPFRVGVGNDIEGFDIAGTKDSDKRPFKGRIVPTPIFAPDGKQVPAPITKIPTQRYHLAELMPGQVQKIEASEEDNVKKEDILVSDLTVEERKKQINPKAAIGAVKGRVQFSEASNFFNPTREIVITVNNKGAAAAAQRYADTQADPTGMDAALRGEGQASRSEGLRLENDSQLPFQPNNLNSFQAFMARMDQLFANKYANVFSLQRAVESAKKAAVDISQDFINAETLMYGKTANDLENLDEKVKVISQEMKDAGLIGEDVSQFLIARHAEERNALIAERTDGETLSGSGMSNERAQEVMDSFSPEQKAALESIAKKVDAITKDTRQTMVKFGLESQETIDAFEEMFDNYVPLGGLSVDEMSADTSLYPTGGAGMSIYGDTTRRAKGRASEANNVLAQAIAQNAAVHAKGRKNEALSSLYNLVENNPNAKVWKISNEVPFDAQSAVGVRVNGEQKFIVFTNPDHAKALKNMGVEKLDLFSKIMRSFSGFLRRSFTTANPEFIISNFARDIQSALFNAMAEADIPGGQIESKYIATKIIERVKQTLPALLKGAVGKDMDPEMAAYFEEFKEDGGQTGWGFVKDVGTIAAEIEAEVNEKNRAQKAREWMMKNSIDVVENVNDAFENSIRLAAYMEARKAGASRQKAAELAKNITVNFNRSGELGAVANAWYMFFNASVQGTVRLARSLGTLKDVRKPNGELESWHKRLNASQKMAFGLSLTTGMLTAINLAMSDEDEDGVLFYNKIPDYEKERNLIIMYDGKNYLKIPLPYGFNVFANMGSAMAEVAGGQRDMTDAGMFLLNSAFSSFSPVSFGQSKDAAKYLAKGATPTIFKPLVDIAVNESYFGSSVYKEQFPVGAPKPEAEMSFRAPEGVRSFFQWMNEATGGSEFVPGKADFNPDKFWYGFEYYIGGAGQFVTRTLGTGRDAYEMIKEGEKVPMKANDFPFLRKLYGEFSKYYDSDVYVENANLVSQLYKERKEADNKNDKRYRGIMKLESARKRTEKQIKRLRELRKEARDIENYVDRQNRIYELYEKERSLLMQFNKQFEQLRGQD